MPNVNQEIVMETTHGRKNKCKTEFKAVVNKVLVSGLVLATLMTSTVMPALAATDYSSAINNSTGYSQSYGVSVEQSVSEIRNTIAAINEMKAKGSVSDAMIQKLATQIYALEMALCDSNSVNYTEINNVLDEASTAISGLSNKGDAEIAIVVVKTLLNSNTNFKDAVSDTSGIKVMTPNAYEDSYVADNYEATQMVKGFRDVQPGSWYYETVMAMTEEGLFAGKGDIVDGYGVFAPNDTMSRAEFITVVSRILYPDAPIESVEGAPWWHGYYVQLVDNGIIDGNVFNAQMDVQITRQEMAYISIQAMKARGESIDVINRTQAVKKIPDFHSVGSAYQTFVGQAYSEGIINGADANGTFKPLATLTRAEAATVLYRIINVDSRKPVDLTYHGSTVTPETQGTITIKEGEKSERRFAKEGDIVIKADGTQVVLKKGVHGILGEGQGVAPDLGVINEGFTVTAKNITKVDFAGGSGYYDSTGTGIKNGSYFVNELTGEGHWDAEWMAMTSKPTTKGSFLFQLSPDKNWIWNSNSGEWMCAYVNNISDQVIQQIYQANGL